MWISCFHSSNWLLYSLFCIYLFFSARLDSTKWRTYNINRWWRLTNTNVTWKRVSFWKIRYEFRCVRRRNAKLVSKLYWIHCWNCRWNGDERRATTEPNRLKLGRISNGWISHLWRRRRLRWRYGNSCIVEHFDDSSNSKKKFKSIHLKSDNSSLFVFRVVSVS